MARWRRTFWRSPSFRRPLPTGRADGEVQVAPRRLFAPGVPESEAAVGEAQQRLTRGEVRLPVVARFGAKDGVVPVLGPGEPILAYRKPQRRVLVVLPVAAVH